ncbi:MAG: hypothetical protein AAF125_22175, partial [Chloroflexota bacterium]
GGFDTDLEFLEDWDLWLRFSASDDFLPVRDITSFYRLPSEKSEISLREAEHQNWQNRILTKHKDLVGVHRFEDITTLPDRAVNSLSFRRAASVAFTALLNRILKIGG